MRVVGVVLAQLAVQSNLGPSQRHGCLPFHLMHEYRISVVTNTQAHPEIVHYFQTLQAHSQETGQNVHGFDLSSKCGDH